MSNNNIFNKLTSDFIEVNAKVPKNKILVKIIENKDNIDKGIYIPKDLKSNSREGIIIDVGGSPEDLYYEPSLERYIPINVRKGDIVLLNFVSNFSTYTIEGKHKYTCITPSMVVGIFNKKYYNI